VVDRLAHLSGGRITLDVINFWRPSDVAFEIWIMLASRPSMFCTIRNCSRL
jgi:hypothetical protein